MKILTIHLRYWTIRLLYLLLFSFLFLESNFYLEPQIETKNFIFPNPLYSIIDLNVPWLNYVYFFILYFIEVILILFVLIIYYSIYKRRNEKTDKKFKDLMVKQIFEYIYLDEKNAAIEKQKITHSLKSTLRSNYAKRHFIITLVDVHSHTQGIVKVRAAQLLNDIKFDDLIQAYLRSPYVKDQFFALQVIAEFQLKGYEKYVLKLTKSKNNVLYVKAILTLIRLDIYNDLMFLVDMEIKLTLWDINQIVKTVQEQNIRNINYTTLIQSPIPETTVLGLILARLHKRIELKNEVMMRIGHSNTMINEEAFLAYTTFANQQSNYDYLMEKFNLATPKAQNAIIQSLASNPEKAQTIQFLNWIVENKHYTLKIEALKLLLEMDLTAINRHKISDDNIVRLSCLQVLDINL